MPDLIRPGKTSVFKSSKAVFLYNVDLLTAGFRKTHVISPIKDKKKISPWLIFPYNYEKHTLDYLGYHEVNSVSSQAIRTVIMMVDIKTDFVVMLLLNHRSWQVNVI